MTSASSNKKGIADFLWEWAETQGDWGKLLVDKIARTEHNLISQDRQLVFDYFLQSVSLHVGLPALKISKPSYTPVTKEIQLTSLSEITGVNRLAKNQNLTFSPNITIIYGENGTGKTGYSRVLKSLGFSYDTGTTILPNVHALHEPKGAAICYTVDGNNKTFAWVGKDSNLDLENISVFNSHCVQISLADRQLIVSPIGFHLFNLVTSELQELQKLMEAKRSTYPLLLAWSENLNPGSPQQLFMSSLSSKSTPDRLEELAKFTEAHQKELEKTSMELSNLNKTLLENEIKTLNAQRGELAGLVASIHTTKGNLSSVNWVLIKDWIKEIQALESQTQTGLKEIAESKGIALYATLEFQEFISSAEKYIKLMGKQDYPGDKDICVYCRQPLDDASSRLLTAYRKLLNDKTQEKVREFKKKKSDIVNRLSQVDPRLTVHQFTFGINADRGPSQPAEILQYNERIELLKSTFLNDSPSVTDWKEFDYQKYLDFLEDLKRRLDESVLAKEEIIATLAGKEKELRIKMAELVDRKTLASKLAEIKATMDHHKIVQVFKDHSGCFNSGPLSRKTTEAREELVSQNFDSLFRDEMKALLKSDIKIDLNFGTERGNSKVTQRISSYVPVDILSEGEQKAIALAEFLTELQLDNIKAPVIFDDPVNSLDHRVIDEVAKRLVRLSADRQVIVFTHSILLLNSFLQQRELETTKKYHFVFHSVKNNFGETGILDKMEEINSITYYIGKVNFILDSGKEGKTESELAAEGYGHLRSAIEMLVEAEVLQNVVKRYRKGVAFPSFLRIDGSKIDECKNKLNDIYEKCCVSISGHASPEGFHTTPTVSELKSDFEGFKKIRTNFKEKKTN